MVNQMYGYFDNIFSPFISGLKPKRFCETVLMITIEHIKQSLDQGKIVCLVLMDLSQTFDCITDKLFIARRHVYGLSTSAGELTFNYFRNRKQRVKLVTNISEWQCIYIRKLLKDQ